MAKCLKSLRNSVLTHNHSAVPSLPLCVTLLVEGFGVGVAFLSGNEEDDDKRRIRKMHDKNSVECAELAFYHIGMIFSFSILTCHLLDTTFT